MCPPSAWDGEGGGPPLRSPYSLQYETIVAQGHERPTPAFGAPTLIWHVAIWPRSGPPEDGHDTDACDPHDTAGYSHGVARERFEQRRYDWIEQINSRLSNFEKRGRWRKSSKVAGRPKRFLPNPAPKKGLGFREPSQRIETGSVGMTLWWKDLSDPAGEPEAVRVRMHCELTADYVTYSFYMDIGQLWGGDRGRAGKRRSGLMAAIDTIRQTCQARLSASAPAKVVAADEPPLPEVLPPEADEKLMAARNLLYVSIWEDFASEMQCGLAELAGSRGEVFANFRGLVLATDGLPRPGAGADHPTVSINPNPFPKFSADPDFDADGPEPNAIVKAYWPFIRRITPEADYREFVACGVLNWRALYVTALGSSSQWDADEERASAASDKTERDIGVRERCSLDVSSAPAPTIAEFGRAFIARATITQSVT